MVIELWAIGKKYLKRLIRECGRLYPNRYMKVQLNVLIIAQLQIGRWSLHKIDLNTWKESDRKIMMCEETMASGQEANGPRHTN